MTKSADKEVSCTEDEVPLSIQCENSDEFPIDVQTLYILCRKMYNGESLPATRQIDLIFCSEETIQYLNKQYRNKDPVTDILSFPFDDTDYLGEIYICTTKLFAQAQEYDLSPIEECSRLFVHGFFHLLGYDHLCNEERICMEKQEKIYFNVE